jgi:large subunit ribosomal protein L22
MNIQATIRGVRLSPRKIGLVAALVRGRSIADALTILEHTPKRAAKAVSKAVASAKANAVTNHRLDEKTLVIEQLQVTAGPRLKRFRPAAMGRAQPYQKRTSHIHIVVNGAEKPKKVTNTTKAKATEASSNVEKKEQ